MKMICILVLAIIALLVIIGAIAKMCHDQQKEIKALGDEIKKQQANMAYLVTHAEEFAIIEHDQNTTDQKLTGGKSDEEICDIINSIISINNERVRKQAQG